MSDPTLQDVMIALRKADAEGNVEDARKLAAIADRLSKSQLQQDEGPTFDSVMGQLNKEIAEGVGGLVDFINPFDAYTGSAVTGLKSGMEAIGIDLPEREAQGRLERAAAGVGQAASAAIPIAKGAQYLQQAGGLVGNVARQIAPQLMTKAGFGAELLAGAGSGAAQAEAERRGYGETVQNLAGIAGGVGVAALPAALRSTAQGAAQIAANTPVGRGVTNLVKDAAASIAPFTSAGAERLVSQRFQQMAGGADRAARIVEQEMGESAVGLTPAAKTGDENFARLERAAMDRDAALRERIEAQRAASDVSARQALTPEGDVADTQSVIADRLARFNKTMNGFIEAAQRSALQKVNKSGADDAQSSVILREELQRSKQAAKAERDRLWGAIPKDGKIETPNTNQLVISQKKTLGDFSAKDVPPELTKFRKKYAKKDKPIKVRDILDLYSKLRATARDATSGDTPNNNMARLATEASEIILKDLDAVDPSTALGRAISEARDYTLVYHNKFTRGTVGNILAKKPTGDPRIRPELTLEKTVAKGSPIERQIASRDIEEGLTDIDGIDPTQGLDAAANYIRAQFDQQAFDGNVFNMSKAQAFLEKYGRTLSDDTFASVRADIDRAIQSQSKLGQVTARAETAMQQAASTPIAAFSDRSADTALDAILGAKNPAAEMASLMRIVRKDESGAALNGLKAALSQRVLQKSTDVLKTVRSIDAPTSEVRGTRMQEALSDKKFNSIARQVFDGPELNRLKVISREMQKLDIARAGGATSGGIDPFKTNKLIEIVARIFAAEQGGRLGARSAGGSMQIAGMMSERMRKTLAKLTTNKAEQLMMRAVEDEELFKTLMLNPTSPKNFAKIERSLAPYLAGAAAASQEN